MNRYILYGSIAAMAVVGASATWIVIDGPAPSAPLAIELRPGDAPFVAIGQDLYQENCASCHGARLEGAPNWRRRNAQGRLPAPPHDETGHTWHHPDEALFQLTKYGPAVLVGNGYESDMPGFESTLTDEEILAILSFIKSEWPEEIQVQHDGVNARGGNTSS